MKICPSGQDLLFKKLVDKGLLKGNEKGELGLNDTMLKNICCE